MQQDVKEILFSKEIIAEKVKELGAKITADYIDQDLLVVGILKGSSVFMTDLIREIELPIKMDYMIVSSYGNSTESSGVVRIIKDLEESIKGKHVLIVEDIIDSGLTLKNLQEVLQTREPASIKLCTFLDKPARRKEQVDVEYIGYEVPDEFIVGYGIDYAERYRNLPYIAVLKEEVYNK